MSEQMQKEFAAWYLREVTESYGKGCRAQAQKNLEWAREDGSFADPMLRLACLAWQASRESAVIERPEDFTDGGSPNARILIAHHREIVGRWISSIKAAGLKVQP